MLFILTSCNSDIEPNLELDVEPMVEIAKEPTPQSTPSNLEIATDNWITEEELLYDIELIIRHLEESFPFIGVAERLSNSENAIESFRNTATYLLEYRTVNDFFGRIDFAFNSVFVGHLGHLDLNRQVFFRATNSASQENQRTFRTYPPIIEEGRIALIRVPPQLFQAPALGFVSPHTQLELQNFIAEIQGYEHVIIDLRHIGGGWIENFVYLFIAPNISEPISFQEFSFIKSGELSKNTYETAFAEAEHIARFFSSAHFLLRKVSLTPLVPATDFVQHHNLINMNQEDLENLAYGFTLETRITPSYSQLVRRQLQAENIWLLIGPNNYSGAEWVARLSEKAGFTIVGEQANRRIGGAGRATFQLPNTRHFITMDTFYITDSTGRAMEEFPIEPHYFNRPGMDALQTTLAIIAERSETN